MSTPADSPPAPASAGEGRAGEDPAGEDPSAALVSSLRVAVARLARRLRQEATTAGGETTPSRLSALASIEREGPLSLGELAVIEQVQPPTMTRIVAHLEDAGLVARRTDASDRRFVRVAVTDEGRRFLASAYGRRDAYLARRVAHLDRAEQDRLAAAVPLLERLFEDEG